MTSLKPDEREELRLFVFTWDRTVANTSLTSFDVCMSLSVSLCMWIRTCVHVRVFSLAITLSPVKTVDKTSWLHTHAAITSSTIIINVAAYDTQHSMFFSLSLSVCLFFTHQVSDKCKECKRYTRVHFFHSNCMSTRWTLRVVSILQDSMSSVN